MKYIHKLREDHPDWNEFEIGYKVADCCPGEFGYPEDCDNDCEHCWYKEFPTNMKEEPKKTLEEVLNNSPNVRILDSGDRTQFESGAVRDMREGKGRCDLAPVAVAARVFSDPVLAPREYDVNLDDISKFQNTNKTCYLYYVLRRFALRHFGSFETMLLEVAKHFEEGAKKYGENNWQKGIPTKCYIDSAIRHYLKWRRGDNDEPHDRAFCWNLMCCIWEVDYGEEWRNEQSLKEMIDNMPKTLEPKERQITVTKKPYECRLGDYTKGLFEFDDDIYAKINTATDCGTCVNIITGIKREFYPDILVTTVDIGEIFCKEEA